MLYKPHREMEEKRTSFYKGQIPVRVQGQTKCFDHKTMHLFWFCKTCCDVICLKCANKLHKEHDIIALCDITHEHKSKIKTFIDKTEKTELIEIEKAIISTRKSLDKHLIHFGDFENERSKCLISYINELEKLRSNLAEQLKHCKETLNKGTDIQVFDLSKGLQINITLPEKPDLGSADFSINTSKREILQEDFGILTSGHSQSQQSTGPDQSYETSAQHNRRTKEDRQTTLISSGKSDGQTSTCFDQSDEISVKKVPLSSELQRSEKGSTDTAKFPENVLLPQIKILSEWKSPCTINAMCPTRGGDEIWTSDCLNTKLTHLTCQGEVQVQIRSDFLIKDNALSPTTGHLWACSGNVMELVSGELIKRFETNDEPRCLCVTRDEHILVGTKQRITKFTPEGKTDDVTKTSGFKKAVVCSPWRISQCPLSDNVAIVDRDQEKDGGKGKPAVIVLDRQLQELYRYGQSQHNSGTDSRSFDPWDLTYDSFGFLVVADYANNRLHLLRGDGQYLRLLYTDQERPRAVCVDKRGVLWAVFGRVYTNHQKVKRLQYTNV